MGWLWWENGGGSGAQTLAPLSTGQVRIQDIVADALIKIRAARAGETINPDDLDLGGREINALFDSWNTDRRAVYNEVYSDFPLTPNHSPHTIGPGGDFDVPQRPVSLEYASINLGGTPNVFIPINVRDDRWYQDRRVPTITQTFPTDVYYSKDWKLGQLFFYGVPTTAYAVRLWVRVLLSAVALTDPFSMPPGYREAVTWTLAERLASSFGQNLTPASQVVRIAQEARDRIFSDNDDEPVLETDDAGLPHPGGIRTTFNYRSRSF